MRHQRVVDRCNGEQPPSSGVVGQFQRIGQVDAHDVVVDLGADDELLGFFFKTFIFSSDEYHFATVHALEYKTINFGDIEFLAFVYALFLWF